VWAVEKQSRLSPRYADGRTDGAFRPRCSPTAANRKNNNTDWGTKILSTALFCLTAKALSKTKDTYLLLTLSLRDILRLRTVRTICSLLLQLIFYFSTYNKTPSRELVYPPSPACNSSTAICTSQYPSQYRFLPAAPQLFLRCPQLPERSWFRHCATSLKVADSISDGITGIYY